MSQRLWFVAIVLFGLGSLALAAQDVAVLYNGQPNIPAGLTVGLWGATNTSDTAPSFTPVAVASNTYGIPIASLGRNQGIRFDVQSLDAHALFGQPNVFIELYLRAVATVKPARLHTVPAPTLSSLRCTFFTEKGNGAMTVPATEFYPKTEISGSWIKIDLPLSRLDKSLTLGGKLHRLVLSTDTPSSFVLGRLAFVRDDAPITADLAIFPASIEAGAPVYFTAHADAGLAACEVRWDFDTALGASVDAMGDRVTYRYPTAGTYVVTCTVRDVHDGKSPLTVTREVKVVHSRK